jgi:SAM-dependent methyltransferase
MKSIPALALLALLLPTAPLRAAEEVPFVVTPDNVTLAMLEQARVGPRDYVIDLGSGDGRIVIVAAKRFGARGLGIEIVPELVQRSRESARQAGVADRAEFREQDLFTTDLSAASVLTLYLLPEVNLQLRPAILALAPGTRVVSHDWDMGDWKPDRTRVIPVPDKKIGLEKSSKVHYWVVPARIEGTWCGRGAARGATLEVAQRFQEFEAQLRHRDGTRALQGRLEGAAVHDTREAAAPPAMKMEGGELKVASSSGALAALNGGAFVRAPGPEACSAS